MQQPRITIVNKTYFHPGDEDPELIDSRYNRILNLETEDDFDQLQIYKRRMAVTGTVEIDIGNIKNVGMIVIENLEGRKKSTIPTEEELEEIKSKIILVCSPDGHPFARIRPGESLGFEPVNVSLLRIRSLNGRTRICCNVIPGD